MTKDIISLLETRLVAKVTSMEYDYKWSVIIQEFGKGNQCEVFGRMECISLDTSGIASQIEKDTLTPEKIKEFIILLEKSSIFDDECILLWIKLYSEEYKDYFDYMQSVENFRVACLYYLKKRAEQ